MKICRECREEFADDINFCTNDLEVLRTIFNIQKTATKYDRNTNLNYGRNTQFNESLENAAPLQLIEFQNISTYKCSKVFFCSFINFLAVYIYIFRKVNFAFGNM